MLLMTGIYTETAMIKQIDFRSLIKKKMKQQNVSVPQIARAAELNSQTLYNYFSGRSELTAANLQKIFTLLKIKYS